MFETLEYVLRVFLSAEEKTSVLQPEGRETAEGRPQGEMEQRDVPVGQRLAGPQERSEEKQQPGCGEQRWPEHGEPVAHPG